MEPDLFLKDVDDVTVDLPVGNLADPQELFDWQRVGIGYAAWYFLRKIRTACRTHCRGWTGRFWIDDVGMGEKRGSSVGPS